MISILSCIDFISGHLFVSDWNIPKQQIQANCQKMTNIKKQKLKTFPIKSTLKNIITSIYLCMHYYFVMFLPLLVY